MFRKILIANRGEIAVRIIRACKELGIRTVAIYSEIDKEALHTKLADEAICIGPNERNKSYLNIKNILEAACLTNSEAIHPGFGFLSENSEFAKICKECNIKFIGPSSDVIELIGNKINAKKLAQKAGSNIILGSKETALNYESAEKISKEIGFPIMLKTVGGGGGKGIRIVNNIEDLKEAYEVVKKEAKISFGNDNIYIEKFLEKTRHIEIQIMADEYGNIIQLGDRDCSVQRKNQKIIEETPSPILNNEIREEIENMAVRIAKLANYTNIGTIEFLLDKDNKFYFMEMNTRIQVEHSITEYVTGIDIVKEQIRIASGEKLRFSQNDVKFKGHSIECRINAEDPNRNFIPCSGLIKDIHFPGGNGVRIDTAIYNGYFVPSIYDSTLAKLIVYGENRQEAIMKMKRALDECVIDGIETNIDYLYSIIENKKFESNEFDIFDFN